MNNQLLTAADLLKKESKAFELKIRGDCMEPALMCGDRVSVSTTGHNIPGDIVVFHNSQGDLVAHRFLGYTLSLRGIRLMTKPDRSNKIDGLLEPDQILGKLTHNKSLNSEIKISIPKRFFCLVSLVRISFGLALRKLLKKQAHSEV